MKRRAPICRFADRGCQQWRIGGSNPLAFGLPGDIGNRRRERIRDEPNTERTRLVVRFGCGA
jgi:hypothetical protein